MAISVTVQAATRELFVLADQVFPKLKYVHVSSLSSSFRSTAATLLNLDTLLIAVLPDQHLNEVGLRSMFLARGHANQLFQLG
jgi:hypothetical protein